MSWLFERKIVTSPLQGKIHCLRRFGAWEVEVGGNGQSCAYLRDLWKTALSQWLPKEFQAKRILMLGLALGDTIPMYRKRFPQTHMVAVELDPTMMQLSRDLLQLPTKDQPETIIGDIRDVLPKLTGTFDLIVVDVFDGLKVAPSAEIETVWRELNRLLSPLGYILFNTFTQKDLLAPYRGDLVRETSRRYRLNSVGIYRHASAGVIGAKQPKGYQRMWANPAFLQREYGTRTSYELLWSGDVLGLKHKRLPIEHYYGDTEPLVGARPTSRFILWHPTTRTDVPLGWRQWFSNLHRRLTGYHDLSLGPEYWKRWSSQAQRHRKAWLAQTELKAVRPDIETFLAAYHRSGKRRGLLDIFDDAIRQHQRGHGDLLRFYGVNNPSGQLIAAIATLEIPELSLEHHVTSFILPEARKTVAGTGIIEEWFADALQRNVRFLDFDGFWCPGEAPDWKGFSTFKAQFVTHYIRHPNTLWKWVRGTKTK